MLSNSEKMLASLDHGDLAHADKYFERALVQDDQSTLLELAEYLESIGFYPQAKRAYQLLENDFPEVKLSLAQIAAEDGDIEEAFLYLDGIDSASPDYVTALLVMADLYDAEGLTDVAREKLLEAHSLSDESLITFALAEIEYNLEHYTESVALYATLDNREILETTGVSTYQRIGRAYASLGKFEAAIEFLEKAAEIEYEDQTVFELACILYEQENYQRANTYFKQLETLNPDFEGYEYAYALSLHAEHETEQALRLAQQGLTKNEFSQPLLLLASQLSYETHKPEAAESYLRKALSVAEDDEEVLLRLTNLYLEQERYEEIVELANDDIDHILTRWNIAKAYQEMELDEALTAYEALEVDLGANPDFLKEYIYVLREFGYQDKARELAFRYRQLVPDDLEMADDWE
ncbi:tetratricopeptide repeat protein [Streptococcus caprae]|uniref:Tetratricopeptide repeat protein n=1 Tax=Streptococcus caprae TaxID=1640501 RepID=A0ABV8CW40_9STRE